MTDWLGNTTTFTPDADGDVTSTAYGNGVTATAAFDADDQISGITDTGPGGAALASFGYTRDAGGRVASVAAAGAAGGASRPHG